MQLRHLKTLLPPAEGLCKVTAVAWSSNNRRLAVVTTDRIVHLFDAMTGERKDKFSTKPAEKGDKAYIIRSLQFSPDSSKLAVAQSDQIVFVYKLGLDWGEKKSICNKFHQSSSITGLTWPIAHPNEVVFGLADGKVKIGQLRSNKPATLYATGSYVVSICSNNEGTAVLSGHLDQSVYRFVFDDTRGGGGPVQSKITMHTSIPYALAWNNETFICAGSDRKVCFYNSEDGKLTREFDFETSNNEKDVGEFTCATFNPSGDACVLGNFNSIFVFALDSKRKSWEEACIKYVENLYSVSTVSWKRDGSRVAVGSVCGVLDLYDACVRRYRYKDTFEFTYVSASQVIVKRLSNGNRVVIVSQFGCEILKLNIFQDRFLVANSTETLLLGDLDTGKLSEVPWQSTKSEKYIFENENACVIYQAGELSLVEYGQNDILGCVRTEHMSSHLLSLRINERPPLAKNTTARTGSRGSVRDDQNAQNKKIAYLLDSQTISVKDLENHGDINISHDIRIDWMELNARADLLLFRDKRRQLHLFDLSSQNRSTLLNYCNYVQWVPDSDVAVAQNRNNLYVWYNIRSPDQATIYQIKGDVEEIERGNGKTEVLVDEGMNTASYLLDENLIAFGTAIDDGNLNKAVSILEPLEITRETEVMWKQLSDESLEMMTNSESNNQLDYYQIAERCAAALGDVSRCRFLRKMNKSVRNLENEQGDIGSSHWQVRSKLYQLQKDFRGAEDVLLNQGQTEKCIEMYQKLHKFEDSIRVATSKKHPDSEVMKNNYYQYLLSSKQEEKAARLKEDEGDHLNAVSLYLKGGYPAKAAQLIFNQQLYFQPSHTQLLETVTEALETNGMYEKAGDLLEKMREEERALDFYLKANSFRKAIDLARKSFPRKVIQLEEAWGDYLVSQKQIDMAINHYIEANVQTKAVEAALNSRQWNKASQLVETLDEETARPFYRRLARHFQDEKKLTEAEECFIRADAARDAVEMYTRANKWDKAYKVALNHLETNETNVLYISEAQRMESEGKLKEAEKLYITVNEPDLAINMYKKKKNYDQMIRLVAKFRKDLLNETHLYLAQQLEHEGNLKESEHHFAQAGEWQSAVSMYRSNEMWDEAIRVAKYHGGINASKRVAYAWAMSLGGEAGSKLLTRLGLIEPAIDYAIESGAFEHAFELARNMGNNSRKLLEVHLKHALFLEDEERFEEAECEFVKANKPREAVDMYIHQQDWSNAIRVAENNDPSSVSDVFVAQARLWIERKELNKAEVLFLNAGKPELALAAYQEASMWEDATRLAKRHLPHKISEINMAYQRSITSDGGVRTKEELLSACRVWESSHQYVQAIDAYLAITINHLDDVAGLEEIWMNGVRLANTHDRSRYKSIVEEVAGRLVELNQFQSAATMYQSIDKNKQALDCYMQIGDLYRAKEFCENHAPEFLSRVQEKLHEREEKGEEVGDSNPRIGGGDGPSSIEAWVQRGDWTKVLQLASQDSPKMYSKYLSLRCRRLCEHGQADDAIQVITSHGVPRVIDSTFLKILESVAQGCLGCSFETEKDPEHQNRVGELFSLLYKIHSQNKMDDSKILEDYLYAAHYAHLQHICAQHESLKEIASRISMTLLRYTHLLPVDKFFYLAGVACRSMNWLSAAFVFCNRYLDLSEAIEDGGDGSMLDNTDFLHTDFPKPTDFNFNMSNGQYLTDENLREELREWVLTISMDQQVEEKLPEVSCATCGVSSYEGCLYCTDCSKQHTRCIISGFPVHSLVKCTHCDATAERENWNRYIKKFQNCPWCHTSQKLSY